MCWNCCQQPATVHDLATMQKLADRVLVLENGRVAQLGPPGEVDAARYVGQLA